MRPFIHDLDDFDNFDSPRARRLHEKQRRKAAPFGNDPSAGPRHKHRDKDYDDYEDYDDYDDEENEDYEDYEDYDDYREVDFAAYARVHHPY